MDIETVTWNALGSQESYNFREISNFVYKLEKDAAKGKMSVIETFMLTDNTTVEADYHNGKPSSPELFELFSFFWDGLRDHISCSLLGDVIPYQNSG